MSVAFRRVTVGIAAVLAVVAVAVYGQQGETPTYAFRITLGLLDKGPADWSGKIAVADGEVVELAGWRFEDTDAVDGKSGWKCRTRNFIAPEERYPLTKAPPDYTPKPAEKPWPNGITLVVRGQAPTVTLTLPGGEVKFKTSDVPLGDPKLFIDKQVRVERMPATALLREAAAKVGEGVQDDYPAFWIRYRTGKHYLAWVAYQMEKDRVLLSSAMDPTASGPSLSRWPALAIISASRWPARMTTRSGSCGPASASTAGTSSAGPTRTASSAPRCASATRPAPICGTT
jgi:hypothetical protein